MSMFACIRMYYLCVIGWFAVFIGPKVIDFFHAQLYKISTAHTKVLEM